MVQKVNLNESEHALNILERLDKMKVNQQRCDFIVKVDDDEYHAHTNILCAGSDYFNAMLTHDTKENQLGKVEMLDVDSECVRICIDYIYTGKAEIPDDKAEQLLYIASIMQLQQLCDGISEVLKAHLIPSTYYNTERIAQKYRCEKLLVSCSEYKELHYFAISSQNEFLLEDKDDVAFALESNLTLTAGEKLMIFFRWIGKKPERSNFLAEMLGNINLDDVSSEYRRHLMESHPLVRDDLTIFKIFARSICDTTGIQNIDIEDFFQKNSCIVFDGKSRHIMQFNYKQNTTRIMHKATFPAGKFFSAVYLDSRIYVLNGDKTVFSLEFTSRNAVWKSMSNMLQDHGGWPPVVAANSKLHVIGGSGGESSAAIEQYLPDEDRWERMEDLPTPIEKATLVALNGFVYSIGGYVHNRCTNAFSRLNPRNSIWADLEPMKRSKRSCGSGAVNPKIFAMGGFDGLKYYLDFECYDTVSAQWTNLTDMLRPRASFNVFHADSILYVVGGRNQKRLTTIECYDLQKCKWMEMDTAIWEDKDIAASISCNADS